MSSKKNKLMQTKYIVLKYCLINVNNFLVLLTFLSYFFIFSAIVTNNIKVLLWAVIGYLANYLHYMIIIYVFVCLYIQCCFVIYDYYCTHHKCIIYFYKHTSIFLNFK